jgi:hypothetical protein
VKRTLSEEREEHSARARITFSESEKSTQRGARRTLSEEREEK